MTGSQLIAQIHYLFPEQQLDAVKTTTIPTNPNILIELNNAQNDLALRTICLPDEYAQQLTADTETFDMDTDWITLDLGGGVWYLDADSDWQQLEMKPRRWLNQNFPGWMNDDSSEPQYYFVEGNQIHLYPQPDTTRSNGLKMYGGIKPTDISSGYDYAFNNKTHLVPFHPLLSKYVGIVIKASQGKWEEREKLIKEYAYGVAEMKAHLHGGQLDDYEQDIEGVVGYFDHFKR